jgi:general secretion pathway protein G
MVNKRNLLSNGFTLIELMVVMAIVATLLSVTMPRYFHSVDKSKEVALRADLKGMREAIDKYYGDNSKYPDTLDDLVRKKYIHNIPLDPMTGTDQSWILVSPDSSIKGRFSDIKSGAQGLAIDGTSYADW